MTHASTETLVALLDGELSELEERRTTRHIEECPHCSEELADLAQSRTLFEWALHSVDAQEPRQWHAALAASQDSDWQAKAIGPAPLAARKPKQPAAVRAPSRVRQTALRWAAGLVLVAGAAAGALMTPTILERVFTREPSRSGTGVPAEAPELGGVAVQPVAGAATIALSGVVEGTRLQVVFEARNDVMMDYRGAPPAFVARDGEIAVRIQSASTLLRLHVPAAAREVRVLVEGEPVAVLVDGGVVGLDSRSGVQIEVVSTEH